MLVLFDTVSNLTIYVYAFKATFLTHSGHQTADFLQ